MERRTERKPVRGHAWITAAFAVLFLGLLAVLLVTKIPCLGDRPEEQRASSPRHGYRLAAQASDPYLLPTDTEYITVSDLDRFTIDEVALIRNEIYARHGYDFQTETIRAYFDAQSWYEPIPGMSGANFDASVFNAYEAANVGVILAYEKERRASEDSLSANGQNNVITDHLASKTDVKNYALEMAEPGDMVIFITGLQESWDGYPYHWLCTAYEDDPSVPIAQDTVRGYSVNYGPTVLSLPKLNAGTYHLQVTAASSINPFMTAFTTDSYSIRFIRYYRSALPAYDGDGLQTFHNANDVLWAFDGTGFLKTNDGECSCALMESRDGAIVPVLIGADAASVEYMVSSTGEIITARGPVHHKGLDIDYYYSGCEHIDRYTEEWTSTSSLPILFIGANSAGSAAEKILDMQEEEKNIAEYGRVKYWLMQNKVLLAVGGVIALFVVLGLLARNEPSHSYHLGDGDYSSYSGSYGDPDYESLQDDLDLLQHARELTEKYGPDWTGYDPEASDPSDYW